MPKRITCCPHCGSEEGYYTLSDYVNVQLRQGFDGSELDNSDMFSECYDIRNHRYAYCIDCEKVICNAKTIFRQIESEADHA